MHIAVIFGTRPEAIKMAPVIQALRAEPTLTCSVWSTGQHRQMLDQVLGLFNLKADGDLGLMKPSQSLNDLFASVVSGVDSVLRDHRPDLVLVHGDTTTAAAAATAAFNLGIPVGHVEAGLRSGRMDQPWPEEFNRRLTDMVSTLMFAPTERARDNLLAEGAAPDRVLVTGNTVVDALLTMVERIDQKPGLRRQLDQQFSFLDPEKRLILVTGHRRESFGDGFADICKAIRRLGDEENLEILYPVHLNPNVRDPVHALLDGQERIHLIDPVDYESFVYLMDRCDVILTDSGGVQEEAPSLGKPVLIMRDVTERPEAVDAGRSQLVGTDPNRIVSGVFGVLGQKAPTAKNNPYGDGRASRRIVQGILDASDHLR